MKSSFLYSLGLFSGIALLSSCERERPHAQPPTPVSVAQPIERQVELTETYTGRLAAVEEVDLRARVSGYVQSVHFTEGQKVEKGQLMFQIDPRLFDAALAAANAKVKQAEARRKLAQSNLARAEDLVKDNAISREEADVRRSEFEQAEADLLVAQAGVQTAALDREFANVEAPISGIASRFLVTPGNYITGGLPNSTLLATIVPHHPIHCYFEVDERQVLKFTRMFFEGKTGGRAGERPTVDIAVSDSDAFEFKGTIDFSENRLDESTATIQLRALVENENEFLTPGLFARVRIPIGEPFQAILVRDSALGFDQSKRFAWILQEDGTVKRRFVETGPLEGSLRMVTSGVTTQDRLVVSRIQLLQDGASVTPTPVEMAAESSAQTGEATDA